jgi:SAM-dependent methyltransferase
MRSTRELRAAYDAIYEDQGIAQLESFYEWVLSLLEPEVGKSLLDVSCGSGALVAKAKARGLEARGIDLSERAVRDANTRLGPSHVVVGDAELLPFADGAFDYISNIGSIEHYLNPDRGVAETARVLDARGKACILLPNSYSLLENVWTVLWTGTMGDQGQPIERYATRLEWERLLVENGLQVYRTVRYNLTVPRNWSDWLRCLSRPRKLMWLFVSMFVPFNLSNCFVYLCRKK